MKCVCGKVFKGPSYAYDETVCKPCANEILKNDPTAQVKFCKECSIEIFYPYDDNQTEINCWTNGVCIGCLVVRK